jgi:hypothetical protein
MRWENEKCTIICGIEVSRFDLIELSLMLGLNLPVFGVLRKKDPEGMDLLYLGETEEKGERLAKSFYKNSAVSEKYTLIEYKTKKGNYKYSVYEGRNAEVIWINV